MLICRGAFRLGYQQVTPHLKLLGEEAPHPKLGICTAIPIFLFCLCTNSKFSMSGRPSVKEKDDEKKSDDKETCEKRNKKLSYRRGTARCVVSIEILPIVMQQCRNYLYDKS